MLNINTNYNNYNSYNTSFTSRNSPIAPCRMEKCKELVFHEIDYNKDVTAEFINKIKDFFQKNFMIDTKDDFIFKYNDKTPKEKERLSEGIKRVYQKIFENNKNKGDFTVLLGTDRHGEIQSACITYGDDFFPNAEKSVLCIDSLAVNKKYRGNKLGEFMLDKIIKSNKNQFKYIYADSTPSGEQMYKNSSFVEMTTNNTSKWIMDFLRENNCNYRNGFTKPYCYIC